MRLCTYRSERGERAAVVVGEGVADAWDALGDEAPAPPRGADPQGIRALIASDRLGELAALELEPTLPLGDAELAPAIPDPEKIVCIGLNYGAHAAEAGLEPPKAPTIFGKYRNALAAPGEAVAIPQASSKIDFEAEVCVVIGREASNVDPAAALDHVAGYTLMNDLSARDLQFATPQWMAGKVFDRSAPLGPWLVTPEEAGPPEGIEFSLELNGETMQKASTSDLIFGVAELVAHLSGLMTLVPGDLIATGTPSGVGSTRDPRVWLSPGDEIMISSSTLGQLHTTIA